MGDVGWQDDALFHVQTSRPRGRRRTATGLVVCKMSNITTATTPSFNLTASTASLQRLYSASTEQHDACVVSLPIFFSSRFDDAYFLEPETGKTGVSGSECRRNGNGGNARGSPAADSLSLQDDDAHARLKDNNVGEGGAGALRNGGAHETCPTRLTGYEREQEGIEHADRTLSSKSGGMVRVNGHLGGMRQRMDRQIDAHGDETAEKWKISKRPKTTAETGEFV